MFIALVHKSSLLFQYITAKLHNITLEYMAKKSK